jgi:hypothetical protein
VKESIENAEKCVSNIKKGTEDGDFILNYAGYTGTRTRHFYNNICNREGVRYLEIGTWSGSSSISAVYKNNISALFIDNWSQFNGDPDVFTRVIKRFSGDSKCFLLESDCWKVDKTTIDTFNVYLYDGAHEEEDHFKALDYYIEKMDSTFVYIVDDWNWEEVRKGTMRGIKENNLFIEYSFTKILDDDDIIGMPNHKGKTGWWNGIGVFVLTKQPPIKYSDSYDFMKYRNKT